MPMTVIPVIDLKGGTAVAALGGDRAHYRPVRSVLHPGSDPVELARAFRDRLGFRDLYLADLDAIAGAVPNVAVLRALVATGLAVWVDAGVRDRASLGPLVESGASTIVAGLETLRGPEALAEVLGRIGPERLVFSLDLRGGVPIVAEGAPWEASNPEAIAGTAIDLGVRRVLLLDVARVGTGAGIGTLPLLECLRGGRPGLELAVGGGVSGPADLEVLERAGASAVLVASALHDGRIGAGPPQIRRALRI